MADDKFPKTINIEPRWVGLMEAYFTILEHGSEEGRNEVKESLRRLAREVDKANDEVRKEAKK